MRSSHRASALAALTTFTGLGVAACQTPTSLTFVYSTDVDCAAEGPRTAAVVVGAAEAVRDVLEPTSTKECTGTPPEGELLAVGTVVALPGEAAETMVGMKVILGVTRPTDQCGTVADEDGQPWGGCIVARRRLAFLDGEALTVDVPLYRDCIGIPCDEDETCVPSRGCVDAAVSPDDCLGSGCDIDDLGTGSSSAAIGVTTGSGQGGGTTTTTGVTTSTGDGGAGGAGGATSTGSTGGAGQGGGTAECSDDNPCDDADPGDCTGFPCVSGYCVLTPLDGTQCNYGSRQGSGTCARGLCCNDANNCELSALGAACADGGDCASGFCTDGRCCNESCDVPCESCRDLDTGLGEGVCGLVDDGFDPLDECAGACSACSGGVCQVVAPCPQMCMDEGAPCEVCVAQDWVQYGTCSGNSCLVGVPRPSPPPPAPGGPPEPCPGNYRCVAGQGCLTQCADNSQCIAGTTCNAQGNCVGP